MGQLYEHLIVVRVNEIQTTAGRTSLITDHSVSTCTSTLSSSTSPPSHCPCLFFQLLPTMHTAQWLVALELPQYTTALMANGFDDDSTICTLTDDDLIQCGVDNLGHRRKMLVSIKQTIQARDQNHEQTKTVDASSSSSSSCSCSCRPNVCGYITIALIVVGVVVGITLLVKGVTTLCGGGEQSFDSCVQSRLLEEIFGGILLVVGLLCAVLIWCPCMHRVSIGVAERSSRVVAMPSHH